MPTYDRDESFKHDWERLSIVEQDRFIKTVKKMVYDLKSGQGFRKGLRVKGVEGYEGIYEMTWAPDGRATFIFGSSPHEGDVHVIWRRIGSHDILLKP
ncbi:MAG TPA: hypothetical protein VH599_22375 [Ktedonobacterales bacterium]|jgi:hypothetical protein